MKVLLGWECSGCRVISLEMANQRAKLCHNCGSTSWNGMVKVIQITREDYRAQVAEMARRQDEEEKSKPKTEPPPPALPQQSSEPPTLLPCQCLEVQRSAADWAKMTVQTTGDGWDKTHSLRKCTFVTVKP